MNRIDNLFGTKKNNILSIYFTAGYPKLNDTLTIIETLAGNGVDMIEIGIPFSDPMADGPVIQQSNQQALKNGMSLKNLFQQLENVRDKVNIPLFLMGYLNPILQFGMENFLDKCNKIGIDGVILPDLPLLEYQDEYKYLFEKYGIYNVFLISPQTSEERIRLIDKESKGFIYMVSSAATTGAKTGITNEQIQYFERIRGMKLNNPSLLGFGISNNQTFTTACKYANGAIIGSAFVKTISEIHDLEYSIKAFINSILKPN